MSAACATGTASRARRTELSAGRRSMAANLGLYCCIGEATSWTRRIGEFFAAGFSVPDEDLASCEFLPAHFLVTLLEGAALHEQLEQLRVLRDQRLQVLLVVGCFLNDGQRHR